MKRAQKRSAFLQFEIGNNIINLCFMQNITKYIMYIYVKFLHAHTHTYARVHIYTYMRMSVNCDFTSNDCSSIDLGTARNSVVLKLL